MALLAVSSLTTCLAMDSSTLSRSRAITSSFFLFVVPWVNNSGLIYITEKRWLLMPMKPKRPCKHYGCIELTNDGYCKAHMQQEIEKRKAYDKSRPTYHSWYSTARWKLMRLNYLWLNPLCVECSKSGVIKPSSIVDHIKPHKGNKNIFWDVSNLQALCKQCHDIKTAKEDGGFNNKKYN